MNIGTKERLNGLGYLSEEYILSMECTKYCYSVDPMS